MIERIESEAGAEFDRAAERNLARARELYLVNRAKYPMPEEIDVSHILFDTAEEGQGGALAAANDARAKLLAGADFGVLAVRIVGRSVGGAQQGPARLASARQGAIRHSKRPRSRSRAPATSASPC